MVLPFPIGFSYNRSLYNEIITMININAEMTRRFIQNLENLDLPTAAFVITFGHQFTDEEIKHYLSEMMDRSCEKPECLRVA